MSPKAHFSAILTKPSNQNASVIAMDVTFFKRAGGILTVLDVHSGAALYEVETGGYETVWDYEKAIRTLLEYGVRPKAAVVDGKKGVIEMLESYGLHVQMCQFHRERIVRKYTHKDSRNAINSLFNNLPHLFTFEDYPELNIPNTNNKIEGVHSELKRRLANHRGLKKAQKIQFARIFFSGRTGA